MDQYGGQPQQSKEVMLTIPTVFMPVYRLATLPDSEWMAVLSDGTDVIVADVYGRPSAPGIDRAISIVKMRARLEQRARKVLASVMPNDGDWELMTIDLGIQADVHKCEFLMCFARETDQMNALTENSCVELGFALPVSTCSHPGFVLRVVSVRGLGERTGQRQRSGGQ